MLYYNLFKKLSLSLHLRSGATDGDKGGTELCFCVSECSKVLEGGGRSSFAAPLASSQRVPGSTPGAALHLELLVTPLPINLHKFSAEGCNTEVPAPNLIIVE